MFRGFRKGGFSLVLSAAVAVPGAPRTAAWLAIRGAASQKVVIAAGGGSAVGIGIMAKNGFRAATVVSCSDDLVRVGASLYDDVGRMGYHGESAAAQSRYIGGRYTYTPVSPSRNAEGIYYGHTPVEYAHVAELIARVSHVNLLQPGSQPARPEFVSMQDESAMHNRFMATRGAGMEWERQATLLIGSMMKNFPREVLCSESQLRDALQQSLSSDPRTKDLFDARSGTLRLTCSTPSGEISGELNAYQLAEKMAWRTRLSEAVRSGPTTRTPVKPERRATAYDMREN